MVVPGSKTWTLAQCNAEKQRSRCFGFLFLRRAENARHQALAAPPAFVLRMMLLNAQFHVGHKRFTVLPASLLLGLPRLLRRQRIRRVLPASFPLETQLAGGGFPLLPCHPR